MQDDTNTTLETLKSAVEAFVDERDWKQFHSFKNLSMAIAVEAAELMEIFQWVEGAHEIEKEYKRSRERVQQELADVIIAALAFANQCDFDVTAAVHKKIKEIKAKYPVELAKGRADKYTAYENHKKAHDDKQ
jgi:NTP pyrophosphatase (non-canonical NTP hydrolase)